MPTSPRAILPHSSLLGAIELWITLYSQSFFSWPFVGQGGTEGPRGSEGLGGPKGPDGQRGSEGQGGSECPGGSKVQEFPVVTLRNLTNLPVCFWHNILTPKVKLWHFDKFLQPF